MNTDTELRERLERAANQVRIDVERSLGAIQRSAARRTVVRRLPRLALAALVIGLIVVILSQARSPRHRVPVVGGGGSPTGSIIFGRSGDPADAVRPDVLILDAATGQTKAFGAGTDVILVSQWSPDGRSIAFIVEEGGGGRYAIVVARPDASDPKKILERNKAVGTAGADLIALSWSPDGTRIAYSGRSPGKGRTVAIMNADGTGGRVLDGHWESVSWSADGSTLLLSGWPSAPEQFDLYTLHPDGSGLQRLTNDSFVERQASWSPDGSHIVFAEGRAPATQAEYQQDIWVMNADGSNTHPITTWPGFDALPVWSRDGAWIAFASDRDATPEQRSANRAVKTTFQGISIYAMRTDGSETRRLLAGGNRSVFPLSWR